MDLYYHPFSPNARRTLLVIEHLALPVEKKFVDLAKNEHRTPQYLQMNPNGMVPTLVDGDFVLTESRAIMQYLAELRPEARLFPADSRTRADIARWQFWDACQFGPQLGTLFMELVLKRATGGGEPDAKAVKTAQERFERFAGILNGHLRTREYLVGERLTIADFSVATALTYAGPLGLELGQYPGLERWLQRISALPAWQSTIPSLARPQTATG